MKGKISTQFMLGNYALAKGVEVKIIGIGQYAECQALDESFLSQLFNWTDIEMIPLTLDWLKRFGFGEHLYLPDNECFQLRQSDTIGFDLYFHSEWTAEYITHVNQLQNFNKSLTGYDLTLTPSN